MENAPPARASVRPRAGRRVDLLVWAGVLYSVFLVGRLFKPLIVQDRFAVCLFHMITGKPCPFCGLTRAFALAMHGEFGEAFEHHPLWFLPALAVFISATLMAYDGLRGTDTVGRLARALRPLWIPFVIALVIFAAFRLL